jgi:hypothetical protein
VVSGILVVVAGKDKPDYAVIALIPTLLFFLLDAYYLALERAFRQSYNDFIDKLHLQIIRPNDLYVVLPSGFTLRLFLSTLRSISIWLFYVALFIMICLTKKFVM